MLHTMRQIMLQELRFEMEAQRAGIRFHDRIANTLTGKAAIVSDQTRHRMCLALDDMWSDFRLISAWKV